MRETLPLERVRQRVSVNSSGRYVPENHYCGECWHDVLGFTPLSFDHRASPSPLPSATFPVPPVSWSYSHLKSFKMAESIFCFTFHLYIIFHSRLPIESLQLNLHYERVEYSAQSPLSLFNMVCDPFVVTCWSAPPHPGGNGNTNRYVNETE